AVPPSRYRMQYTRPLMGGTRCHMMAMYVVLESYLGMVCDYPEAYEGQPGFEFVSTVPTVWDETRVIDAKVGDYVVIARRKGSVWYVGGITNNDARELDVDLSSLGSNKRSVILYTDASTDPNHLQKEEKEINLAEKLKIK